MLSPWNTNIATSKTAQFINVLPPKILLEKSILTIYKLILCNEIIRSIYHVEGRVSSARVQDVPWPIESPLPFYY